MPQHNPEDRVRVKNILNVEDDDIRTFWITRYRKEEIVDANGNKGTRDIPYDKEIEWNFKDGFFFLWGGRPYVLPPNSEKVYLRFLAEHCAKHMVDHIMNNELLATRRLDADGIPHYSNGILNNEVKRKKLMNEVIVGVEEWYNGGDEDFDAILSKQFGGDAEGMMKEVVDKRDVEIGTEFDQTDTMGKKAERKPITPTSNPELQSARDEADLYAIEYTDKDTVDSIKAKVLKEMA